MASGTSKLTIFVKEHKALVGVAVAILLIVLTTTSTSHKTSKTKDKPKAEFNNAVDKMWPVAVENTQYTQHNSGLSVNRAGNTSQAIIIDRSSRSSRSSRSQDANNSTSSSSTLSKTSSGMSAQARKNVAAASASTKASSSTPDFSKKMHVSERMPLALERAKAIYDVDYAALKQVSISSTIVAEKDDALTSTDDASTLASNNNNTSTSTSTSTSSTQHNSRLDLLLPGTLLTTKMVNGLITTAQTSSPFVAVIQKISSPNPLAQSYLGCYVTGQATLNLFTHRSDLTLESLSCRNSYASLTGHAISSDLVPGLNSKYHERLSGRLLFSFLSAGGASYMDARRRALEETYSIMNTTGETVAQDVSILYPEEYAIWDGLAAAFDSTKQTFADYGARQVPVGTFDPLQVVRFQLTEPSDVSEIYTDAR